jgi:hypothetical protein
VLFFDEVKFATSFIHFFKVAELYYVSMCAAALLGEKWQTDNKEDFVLRSSSVSFNKWKQPQSYILLASFCAPYCL